jgi:putative flippase GtrA
MKQGIGHQLVRYGIVGGTVYVSDFATFAVTLWAVPGAYLWANVAGKSVGALVGFVLHRQFTFSWEHKDNAARQLVSYVMLFAFNLALSSLLIFLLVNQAGANAFAAKLLVDVVVIAVAFIASRLWVYRPA